MTTMPFLEDRVGAGVVGPFAPSTMIFALTVGVLLGDQLLERARGEDVAVEDEELLVR